MISFQVCAKYTFGKPVVGRAKAVVCQATDICRTVTQNLQNDGCSSFQLQDLVYVDDNSFSPRNNKYPRRYTFESTVYEEDTGKFIKTLEKKTVEIMNT